MANMELARITITQILRDDGEVVVEAYAHDQEGEAIGLIETLGMIEMGKRALHDQHLGLRDDEEDGHEV